MTKLRVGGVPEHFNLPWHLAIEEGAFAQMDIDLEWITYDGGTGQMTKALRNDEVDLCILLTEGIITDIYKGNPSKIVSVYINTPLCWGVHTGASNKLGQYQDIWDRQFAISRYGSGSHLMPQVDANERETQIGKDQWVIIKNLEGALDSLGKNESDVFYWEKYTTKPYVDSGQLRRLGSYYSPWPCFVVAATDKIIATKPDTVRRALQIIQRRCQIFMMNDDNIRLVSDRYDQKAEDVSRWFHSTEWAVHGWVSNKMLSSVEYHLDNAGIIDKNQSREALVWRR